MTATNDSRTDAAPAATTTPLKALNEYELKTLARTEGPCITIQVPGFRPGAPDDVRSTLLRQLTHTAAAQLRDFDRSERGSKLLASLEGSSGDPDVLAGGPGLTLCIAPGLASAFVTPEVREHVTVGSRFHLLPLVAVGALPPEVYALGVNQNHIRVWRVRLGSAEELALPSGVPASLADAGAFDQPDHDLENRSSAGPSVGGMRVRFGTSAERGDAYLYKFCKLVADGLQETIKNTPVMLIGVREDLAEYRRASQRGNLLASEWHAAPGPLLRFRCCNPRT